MWVVLMWMVMLLVGLCGMIVDVLGVMVGYCMLDVGNV